MLFILVTGMPGSGKSLVVEVAREKNIPVYTMGDVIREEAIKTYGRITPQTMLETSRIVREKYGPGYVAEKIIERIKENRGVVLIDGVRSWDEVTVFQKYGDTTIFAIHASPKTRFERLKRRGREGDPRTWEEFVTRDMIELNFGIGNVIALADYMVVNEKSIEEVKKDIRVVMDKILGRVGK
ncbi:MAG: dephospho-CoA kinase [Desulfurococcales archaeon ex4484_58]|nr:MAG: dephospho-CoA kinase [Desulfurococcales archaeon ex4484_58]